MAAGDTIHSAGTTLTYGTGSGSATITTSDLYGFKLPETERGVVQSTRINATGKVTSNVAGWRKPGILNVELYFTHAYFAVMKAFQDAGTYLYWKITLPAEGSESNGTTFLQYGQITKLIPPEGEAEADDPLKFSMEITCSGDDTVTEGS